MLVKNLTFQMHRKMHALSTTARQVAPAHTRSNTVTTEHAPKPSSFSSPQPISCQKDAQAAVEVGLTSGTHGHSRELPVSPRDSEEVMRKLPKSSRHSVCFLPSLFLTLIFPWRTEACLGVLDRPCYPVVTAVTSKMMNKTVVLAEQQFLHYLMFSWLSGF